MGFKYQKFPDISCDGCRIIWDSRQIESENEKIFIDIDLDIKIKEKLRKRSNNIVEHDDSKRELAEACQLKNLSQKLKIVGITGTNGKTTCVHMLSEYFSLLGKKVLSIGTQGLLYFNEGSCQQKIETGFTSLPAPNLADVLKQAIDLKVQYVFMEVSSHAIALFREWGLNYELKALTNITVDHLDFHDNFDNYKNCKLSWLNDLTNVRGKSLTSKQYNEVELQDQFSVTNNRVFYNNHALKFFGKFNAYNCQLCFEIIKNLGFDNEIEIWKKLSSVPGRYELVCSKENISYFVDFAHTPDSLEKTLTLNTDNSIYKIVVLGCGGNRDKTKRADMASIACQHSDFLVLTSDNPRDEEAMAIVNGMIKGLRAKRGYTVELDRRLAIKRSIMRAQKKFKEHKEVHVYILGKGDEAYQEIKGQKLPFKDKEVLLSLIKEH